MLREGSGGVSLDVIKLEITTGASSYPMIGCQMIQTINCK